MSSESPAPRPRPRRAAVALGILLPLLVALVVLESGTRLLLERPGFSVSNQEGASGLLEALPDSDRRYGYRPGSDRQLGPDDRSIRVRINEHGFRDDSWQGLEPGGVLAAGDSFTAGWGVDQEEPWPERLERHLEELSGGPLRVVNAGVSGYSVRQIRATVEQLLPESRPRWVVVGVYASRAPRIANPYVVVGDELVSEDAADRIRPVSGGYVRPSWNGPLGPVERFCDRWLYSCSHLLRAVSARLGAGSRATPEDVVAPLLQELDQLRELVERSGASLWIVQVVTQDLDGTVGGFEGRYSQYVGSWCRDSGVRCFDTGTLLEGASDGSLDMRLEGDHHWSPRAHDLVAEELARALLAEVGKSPIPAETGGASG